MQSGLQHGILPLLKPFEKTQKSKVSPSQFPLSSPSSLTSLQSLWLILADGGPVGREKAGRKGRWSGGKKLYTPGKNFFFEVCRSSDVPQTGLFLFLGSREAFGKEKVRPLYVSWFREVGDESYHHPYIDAGAYSDGEGGEEQSPPGGDVGQREVTFVHRLGGPL